MNRRPTRTPDEDRALLEQSLTDQTRALSRSRLVRNEAEGRHDSDD